MKKDIATAYFAGGCFWCIAPIFRDQSGVISVTVGFSGGNEPNPIYEEVKKGKTHHRETIQVCYDPEINSYESLLDLFLWNVDPFDAEGQFIDRGKSYTLAIYYTSDSEYQTIVTRLDRFRSEQGKEPMITVEKYLSFYPAPEEHQNFDLKNPVRFMRELEESGRTSFFEKKRHSFE